MSNPCHGCVNRNEECHSTCSEYKSWHSEVRRRNQEVKKYKDETFTMSDKSRREMWRNMRWR